MSLAMALPAASKLASKSLMLPWERKGSPRDDEPTSLFSSDVASSTTKQKNEEM